MTIRASFPSTAALLTKIALASLAGCSLGPPGPQTSKPQVSDYTKACFFKLEPSLRDLVQAAAEVAEVKGFNVDKFVPVYRLDIVGDVMHDCAYAEKLGVPLDEAVVSEGKRVASVKTRLPDDLNIVILKNRVKIYTAAAEQLDKDALTWPSDSIQRTIVNGMAHAAQAIVGEACKKIKDSMEAGSSDTPPEPCGKLQNGKLADVSP